MHKFLDKYSVVMAAIVLKNSKWFRESVESPSFEKHIINIKLSMPVINGEGYYEVKADSLVGNLDPAFHVVKWLGPKYPTIIYHHGNNESPFNYGIGSKNTFKSIFLSKKDMFEANLISIRAPFHKQGLKSYLNMMSKLSNFTAMLSVSVEMVDALVNVLKSKGCNRVIMVGMSLGGWVTNLHRSFYNSVDAYVPIFAGAALDEVFTTSFYKKLAGQLVAEKSDTVRKVLNFENEFKKVSDNNISPLLARFDQIIEYERQKQCYGEHHIEVVNKGHITGAIATKELRNHILACMNNILTF